MNGDSLDSLPTLKAPNKATVLLLFRAHVSTQDGSDYATPLACLSILQAPQTRGAKLPTCGPLRHHE